MIRAFIEGYREMMALTCFRGPWAYENMARREATPVRTARDLGERIAVLRVRVSERYREWQHG